MVPCDTKWLTTFHRGNQFGKFGILIKLKSLEAFHSLELTLTGGFKYFYFHPYLGKIPILTIFQMG